MVTARAERSTLEVMRAIAGGAWLDSASAADFDRMRSRTEQDCSEIVDAQGNHLLVLADAGSSRGRAPSVQTLLERLQAVFQEGQEESPQVRLRRALHACVAELGADAPPHVAALLLTPASRACVAWLGEARAYAWRSGQLVLLSDDHRGVPAWLDLRELDVRSADRFLLCSRRLTEVLSEAEIAHTLGLGSPVAAAQRLVRKAGEQGATGSVNVQVAALSGRPLRVVESPELDASPDGEQTPGVDETPGVEATPEPDARRDAGGPAPSEVRRPAEPVVPPEPEPTPPVAARPEREPAVVRRRVRRPRRVRPPRVQPPYVHVAPGERRRILAGAALAVMLLYLASPFAAVVGPVVEQGVRDVRALAWVYRQSAALLEPAPAPARLRAATRVTSWELRETFLRLLRARANPLGSGVPAVAAPETAAPAPAARAVRAGPPLPPSLPSEGGEQLVRIRPPQPFHE